MRDPAPHSRPTITRRAVALVTAIACGALLTLVAAGTGDRAAPAQAQAAVGDPAAGASVFKSSGCSSCHTLAAAGATGKVGPNLDTLKPTLDQVTAQVTTGGGAMPPFKGVLSAKQIADVSAYVVQATGGVLPTAPAAGATPTPGAVPTAGAPGAAGTPGATGGRATGTTGTTGANANAGATAASGKLSLTVVKDRRMRLASRRLVAGAARLAVRNPGRQTHFVELLRTNRPVKSLRTRGGWLREPGAVTKVTVRSHRNRRSATVTLAPGRYILTCRLRTHIRRGLSTTLRVVAAPAAKPTPPPPSSSSVAAVVSIPGSPVAAAPPKTQPVATPAPAPEPESPPVLLDGKAMFQVNCGGCHTLAAAGTTGTIGPNLDDKHPDAGKVTEMVNRGKDQMPSFRNSLTADQIAKIASFVSQAVGR